MDGERSEQVRRFKLVGMNGSGDGVGEWKRNIDAPLAFDGCAA